MTLDTTAKRHLAGRARTLHERLESPVPPADGTPVDDLDELIAEWRDAVADGDDEQFDERLAQLDCSRAACRERLGVDGWPGDRPLPDWVDRVDDLLTELDGRSLADADLSGQQRQSVPFAEIVTAIVDYASGQVDWQPFATHVDAAGVRDLEGVLRKQLIKLLSQPLFVEFKTFVAANDRELALADDPPEPDEPRAYYEQFVDAVLGGELRDFFVEYAFLARLLATTVEQWCTVVEEFGERLAADRDALEATLADDGELGRVTGVSVNGDVHAGGRASWGVTFSSGTRVAYKPRPVDVSVAFYDLVSWLDDRADGPALRTVSFVTGDGYGWMEWVEHEACADGAAVERYYQRMGQLLCLAYALRFTDGHMENVVAGGEYPALVDLETLLRPESPGERRSSGRIDGFRDGTVLETGLLPESTNPLGPDKSPGEGDVPDLGGLGASEVSYSGLQIPAFTHVNTDRMDLVYREEQSVTGNNLPLLDGETVPAGDHADAIIEGFERAYRTLVEHRDSLLAADGPLSAFAGCDVRFLTRPTRWYGTVLQRVQQPAYLRRGLAIGRAQELLAKALVSDRPGEVTPSVFRAERTALTDLDIPRFSTQTDALHLERDGECIEDDYFETAALPMARARIGEFDETDLATQRDYLELAFHGELVSRSPPADHAPDDAVAPAPLEQAQSVFDRLRTTAKRNGDDRPTWLLRQATDDGFTAEVINDHVYNGRLGVSLFAAGLYRTTGEDEYRAFAETVVEPVVEGLGPDTASSDRMVGMTGDGATVYGFTTLAGLLGDDQYRSLATEVAHSMTDRLSTSAELDVLQGSAGAILGLLRLYDDTGDDAVLDRARTAGEHLLAEQTTVSGVDVWNSHTRGTPLQGFAHGVSGIAYALCRLAAATGEARFAERALDALAFEHELFDPARDNWIDARRDDDSCALSWCHGRPGIGLARLGVADLVADDRVERDVQRALAGCDSEPAVVCDHLCCGTFGRVEFLIEAARRTGDEQYHTRARELADTCRHRAAAAGGFRGPYSNGRLHDPSFFVGEAGIGYTLLRLENPDLPSVLLFE